MTIDDRSDQEPAIIIEGRRRLTDDQHGGMGYTSSLIDDTALSRPLLFALV